MCNKILSFDTATANMLYVDACSVADMSGVFAAEISENDG